MRLFPVSSSSDSSPSEQSNLENSRAMLYLNIYDLTPINNYLYWFGCGIFHSGIEGYVNWAVGLICLRTVWWVSATLLSYFSQFGVLLFVPVGWNIDIISLASAILRREHLSTNMSSKSAHHHRKCYHDSALYVHLRQAHGLEYGFGAHEYPTSGVFEVEPRSCPGFMFRRSIMLGSTDMSRSEFRSFMEHLSNKYHGDTYNLISKNCNHFTDEVCLHLTGKPIPGWVNRLARLEDGTDFGASSVTGESEEEDIDHHLLTAPNSDMAFLKDKPVRLAKDIL
ncbi:hypothetical protein DH2020_003275 [Rehmannia glutinosa]|uniref:PPPDE domain-containing protein n=1 Tax=Rehmannia glutinosa TaxID=99300 RepID=A0ABR0XLB3_REHGL